jgi:hypothetical protein
VSMTREAGLSVDSVMMPSMTGATDHEPTGLTDDETAMLELERSWWKYSAVKDTVVRERFDISPTAYYSRLNALLERPEAMASDPMTVRRLQRLRDRRREQRSARRLRS